MTTPPTVSVMVPSYRRPDDLATCLRALREQDDPPDEILIVLRPDDETSATVVRDAAVAAARMVHVERPGQVAALNAGRQAATGDVMAITDDDARPRSDWVRRIRSHFAADGRVGAVGGRDVVHHGDVIEDGVTERVGRVRWFGRHEGRHHLRSTLQDVDFVKGANMAFRREALAPFDERLRGSGAQVCNDLEASLAVSARGWRLVYDPEVVVDHHPAVRFDEDARGSRSVIAACDEQHNELYALLRHRPWWQRPLLVAYRVLIGYRATPGLAWAVVRAVRSRDVLGELRLLGALTAARLQAIRTWREASSGP